MFYEVSLRTLFVKVFEHKNMFSGIDDFFLLILLISQFSNYLILTFIFSSAFYLPKGRIGLSFVYENDIW